MQEILTNEVKKFAPGQWVQGAGLNPLRIQGREDETYPITCRDIDSVTKDNPVAIMYNSAHQRGFQVGVHAIGNLAVKTAIDGFIDAMRKHPGDNPRHYVVHGDMLGDNDDYINAAKHDIVLSSQPVFLLTQFEESIRCVGKEKGERLSPLKEIKDLGVVLAGGSDAIAGELVHWRKSVQAAVTRKSAITGNEYRTDLALSVEDAIRMHTINGAYQEKKEHIRGSIEVGKVADFQVLDRDIFTTPPDEIGDIKVVLTMVDGRIVFERD